MAWPFDEDVTVYAYISHQCSHGYAHMIVRVRNLPGMVRTYPDNGSELVFTNQAGGEYRPDDPEAFYAWKTGVTGMSDDPMSLGQLQRAAKTFATIERRMRAADEVAGAPARFIEDYAVRLLRACRAEHVFSAPRVNATSSIDTWDHYIPSRFDFLHSALQARKRELLTSCGALRAAA